MLVFYPFPFLGRFTKIQLTECLPSSLCWNHLLSHKGCINQFIESCNLPFQFKCPHPLCPVPHFYFSIELFKVIYLCMCPWMLNHFNLCPPVCNPMEYSLPGSSVHGISSQRKSVFSSDLFFLAKILEWVAMTSSRGSSRPRDWLLHCRRSEPVSRFSHSVLSDCLQPYEMQHARLSCPSATPGPCSNSYPVSQQSHPTILSSVSLLVECSHQNTL